MFTTEFTGSIVNNRIGAKHTGRYVAQGHRVGFKFDRWRLKLQPTPSHQYASATSSHSRSLPPPSELARIVCVKLQAFEHGCCRYPCANRSRPAPLNPLWLALCWNSHRLSKQSNSGSIRPSIGGIETELVVSRGQEILTGAVCRLPAGGRLQERDTSTHTFIYIYTACTVEDLV